MPSQVTLRQLPGPKSAPSATWIPLGVGGPNITTIGVDLFNTGPHLMLVSGPSGSGRTTAAATIVHALRHVNVGVLAITTPRSPLPTLLPADTEVHVLAGTTIKDADLREAATAFGTDRYAVIVDDCEQITLVPWIEKYSEMPTLLQEIASPGALGKQALVMCGDAEPILSGQRRSLSRVLSEIMTAGTRLLLTPTSRSTARQHDFTLEPDQYFPGPPGRGYAMLDRNTELLHLAMV